MPEPFRRSPLSHRSALAIEAVRLTEIPFVPKHILRVAPYVGTGPLRDALSLDLPREPLTSTRNDGATVLWLGPDEWLALGLTAEAGAALARALSGAHYQLVAVGDYYTIIEVAGPSARELLMKLTTIDLHPRAFRAGQVAGSLFGRANAWAWLTSEDADGPAFRLIVRWSFADYLWCALAEAGREWGLPGQTPVKGEVLLQRSVGG
jgi:sarcosine oxidase, subunit gamma